MGATNFPFPFRTIKKAIIFDLSAAFDKHTQTQPVEVWFFLDPQDTAPSWASFSFFQAPSFEPSSTLQSQNFGVILTLVLKPFFFPVDT